MPSLGDSEAAAASRVLRSGQLAQGPEVAAFEQEFAAMVGVRNAVAVNSGTAAIHAALHAAGVGDGDEVVTTPFTFAGTATPILMQRGRPVFVDIDLQTFNATAKSLLEAVGNRTKAVVTVDLFGQPCDVREMQSQLPPKIKIVDDACQAVGASIDGLRAGALGDIGCFSFYATKNITCGEGGMLTTNDNELAAAARSFRQHGQGERYDYLELGYNYRLTDVLAAVGRAQLRRLPELTQRRRENAAKYDELLAKLAGVRVPYVAPGAVHVYHQYSILIDSSKTRNGAGRDAVRAALATHGIDTGIYYPTPLHLTPLFESLGYSRGDFPNAERAASEILSLPVHPLLSDNDLERVASTIRVAVGA